MARKSKGFGKISQPQRADKIHQKRLKKLQRKIQTGSLSHKFEDMVTNPKGEVKMSEVLQEFVEPYLHVNMNPIEREKLFELAVIVWNLTFVPHNEWQSKIDDFIKTALKGNDPLAESYTREIIYELIARKQELFDEHKRLIVDFELQDTGKEFRISVASVLLDSIPDVADLPN